MSKITCSFNSIKIYISTYFILTNIYGNKIEDKSEPILKLGIWWLYYGGVIYFISSAKTL